MNEQTDKGSISWMARNPVAANLLMLLLMIGGLRAAFHIQQEVFPRFEIDVIMITVPYPGASPEEVERGIVVAVEEAVQDLDGIKHITSTASEGKAIIVLELMSSIKSGKALQDVKNAVDRVTTLPDDTERPLVSLMIRKRAVITLVLFGNQNMRVLRNLAEKVRDDLLRKPMITSVELTGSPPLEISIEISQDTLRKYNLTLDEVAARIRTAAMDYSAGGVKATRGEILLRLKERRDYGMEFKDIPIVSAPDGSEVKLGDIATIIDGFADTDEAAYFNGKPAVMLQVAREGDQTPLEVATAVKDHVRKLNQELPEGVSVDTFDDRSEIYEDRMDLLIRNAFIGLFLVLTLLGVFLNVRLAFWVTLGIPISFLGVFLFLPYTDSSINMISLFAFIMALGIVVDDAIVVGENIYTLRRQGLTPIQAAIEGTKQVSVPVIFAILTNIVAFLPLMYVEGTIGKIFRVIPIVVCIAFIISLIEALYILPAHLGHSVSKSETGLLGRLGKRQEKVSLWLEGFINNYYRPLLNASLNNRYLTVSIGAAVLIVVFGFISSGRMPIIFFPKAETDVVTVGLELPYGSPVEETIRIQNELVAAAQRVLARKGDNLAEGIFSHIGSSTREGSSAQTSVSGGHAAYIRVFLVPMDERDFSGEDFASEWREEAGEFPGVEAIYFQVRQIGPHGGSAIDVELSHRDPGILEMAAVELADYLRTEASTRDVDDGFTLGKPQLDFRIKPVAFSLGLTPADIGRQVRSRFYGAEALRLQRNRDEVKVMVRLPVEERRSEMSISGLLIQTPGGGELPFEEAAEVIRGRAFTKITRSDGRRTINVTSDIVPIAAKNLVLGNLIGEDGKGGKVKELMEKYPGLTYAMSGRQRSLGESMESLKRNFILAMIVIFVMLGVVFKSYVQPLIIMISIPFGIVGAVIGHMIMGFHLSVISMMGITALSGVVLNDSLLLIDFANRLRLKGASSREAIFEAGARRFRPIMLTTMTTFGGLAPMIFETSVQARFLTPMAISLGFGIVFATLIILLLVPSFYMIVEDIKGVFGIKEEGNKKADKVGQPNENIQT